MLTISLKEFALTGEFGPVKIGMHRDAAVALLGKPGDETDFGGASSGFLYGWYEFFYETDTKEIEAIQNDHLLDGDLFDYQNEHFQVDPWFLKAGKEFTFPEVVDLLQEEQIPFRVVRRHGTGPEEIEFKSGVHFDFIEQCDAQTGKESGEKVLLAIRYFPLYSDSYELVYQSGVY